MYFSVKENMPRIWLAILVCFTFYSCKAQQKADRNCAYSLKIIYNQTDEINSPFYLYKDKLIELVLREKTNVQISLKDTTQSQTVTYAYDTTALQIISLAKNEFVQIDSFRKEFKVLKRGNYKESPIGFKGGMTSTTIKDTLPKGAKETYYASLKDTLINGQSFKFDTSVTKSSLGKDSILTTNYYIKQASGLLSIFNQGGLQNPSNEISIAGFTVYFYKQNYSLTMRIENVRPLTKREELICQSIYSKTKE